MKQLKKLELNDFNVMDDREMKCVVGGFTTGDGPTDDDTTAEDTTAAASEVCMLRMKGSNDTECRGSCQRNTSCKWGTDSNGYTHCGCYA